MHRGTVGGCTVVAVLAALTIGCGDDAEDASQCALIPLASVRAALPGVSVDREIFEHEASGDGTWCLYELDGERVETQYRRGTRAAFDGQRSFARYGSAPDHFADLSDVGDAAYRHSAGIPGIAVFDDGWLINVQILDGSGGNVLLPVDEQAEVLARLAADACCEQGPPDSAN